MAFTSVCVMPLQNLNLHVGFFHKLIKKISSVKKEFPPTQVSWFSLDV